MRIAKGNNGKKLKLRNGKLIKLTPSPTVAPSICDPVTSGFSASTTASQATLSWSDSGAVQYNVRYRAQGSTTWSTTVASSNSVVIIGLLSNITYEWQVQSDCTDISLQSGWSATQTFTTASVPPSSLQAGFYRYAKIVDNITPEDFNLGPITESELAAETNFKSAKFFCEGSYDRLQSVDYATAVSSTSRWIKIVSPPGTCCGGSPWYCRIQAYRSTNEQSTVIPDFESEEFFMDVTYYFPNTTLIDPPEPDWVTSTGLKLSPGITGQTGVGVTKGNPQTTGKYEMIFHLYGMQNNKNDFRGSTYTKTSSLTDFHLGASIYAADARTVQPGDGYQHDIFFCNAGGTTRKVFTVGHEYRFRGYIRTNTPATTGPYDGIVHWQLSTDGGAWENLVTVTDWNWRGNYTTKLGQSGWILFRGGGYGWLVGYAGNYPTTIHETNIYMKDYLTGSFPMGNTDPSGRAADLGNMFSFIPDDSIPVANITNVKWDVKNANTGSVLYTGNGSPTAISSTGNFWHGRWIWPVIDLDPAFASTSGAPVQVCKTITDDNGNVSNPFCITYFEDVYDSGPLPVVCSAPTSLTSVPTSTSAQLLWTGDSDATSYLVEYREQGTTNWSNTTTTNTNVTITSLNPSTIYEWRVTITCTGNSTSPTSTSTFQTSGTSTITCDTPTSVVAFSTTDTTAGISWVGDPDATTYTVRWREQNTNTWLFNSTSGTTYTITNLSPSTTYEVQVGATCSSIQSNYSASITFTTDAAINLSNDTYTGLMSVDNAASPSSGDAAMKALLEANGFAVTYVTDNNITKSQAEGYDLVIIGPSSTSHDSKLKWANVSIVWMNHQDLSSNWVANSSTTNGSTSTINITDTSHPITSAFSPGNLSIFTGNHPIANHSQDAPGLRRLAQASHNGNTALGYIEAEGARYEWWALGRIVTLPLSESGAQNLTTDGETLVVNACRWAAAYDQKDKLNVKPHGLIHYHEDNGVYTVTASRDMNNPNATYWFGRHSTALNNLATIYQWKLSKEPTIRWDIGSGSSSFIAKRSWNNDDYKILICDATSGFNHNHGDEAEALFNAHAEELTSITNTTFTVTRDNNQVKSDDLFNYDMLVLASTTGTSHFDADDRERIERFVNNGGSVMSFHAAADAFYHSSVDPNYSPGGGSTAGSGYADITGIMQDYDVCIIHFDGDTQDDDDICAVAVAAILAASAGIADRTHFFIGNNLNEGDTPWQVTEMRNSAAFAEKFGITIHDYMADITGSNFGLNDFSNVRAELVSILSSGQKVLSLEAGPMEAIYRALDDTPVQYHQNITLVSHSNWNEQRKVLNAPGAVLARDWDDIKADFPNVTTIDIENQNDFFNDAAWSWMDNTTYQPFVECRERMIAASQQTFIKRNDPSDAGMLMWALTTQEFATPLDAKAYLETSLPKYKTQFTERESGIYTYSADNFDPATNTNWEIQTAYGDYVGERGYLNYIGSDSLTSIPALSVLTATVDIEDPGKYQLIIRSRIGSQTDPSQENDHWVTFTDADDFYAEKTGSKIYAKGNPYGLQPVTTTNDSVDGYLKFYNNNVGDWANQTSAVDNNKHDIFVEFNTAGTYTFKLAARSYNFAVDQIVLKDVNLAATTIDPYMTPNATNTGGGGGPLDSSNGVWDFYAEQITGVSIQRNPNHTNNNTTGTVTKTATTGYINNQSLDIVKSTLNSTWSHDEEWFYWGPKTSNYTGYVDPKFSEAFRVGSTGSNAYDVARMTVQTYEHPGGGLMFYTSMGHNSSTWNSDTEFREIAYNGLVAAWLRTHFTEYTQNSSGFTTPSPVSDDTGTGGTTYYVAATAVGSGDGSSTANAMDFDTAKAQWNSGTANDTYLFKRGDVFYNTNGLAENFVVTSGGTGTSNEMTFGAYGTGAKPRFSGQRSEAYSDVVSITDVSSSYASDNVWQVVIDTDGFIDANYHMYYRTSPDQPWLRAKKPRTEYLIADGGSGSQLVDSSLAGSYPNTISSASTGELTCHFKGDLYTWEWDTINMGAISGSTYPFVTASHTTSVSTTFPYYLEADMVELMEEGSQTFPEVVRVELSQDTHLLRLQPGIDPSNWEFKFINESRSGISVKASNVVFKNLVIDGFYREGIYIDGSSRTNILFTKCVVRDCFGAGLYNDFNGEFSFGTSLIDNIDGVGIYNNSSQGTTIAGTQVTNVGLDGGQIYGVIATPGRAQNQFHSGITGFGKTTGGQELLQVSGCQIFNIGYNGIRFDGANNLVQSNFVCASMLELSDGGGIYSYGGNATAYTTGCDVINNAVVYTPGNLTYSDKNPDRNLAEGIYLDNGNDGTNVQNNLIAYAGGWGALNNFDNLDCTWDDNVFFGSDRYGLLTFDSTNPASNNNDNNLDNNTFVVWHPDHSPVISLNRTSTTGYEPVDTSDNNDYITVYNHRPPHDNVPGVGRTYTEWVNYGARYHKTLAQWNSSSGYDGSSTETLKQIDYTTKKYARDVEYLVYVNATPSNVTFIKPVGNYYDVLTGTNYSTSAFTIPGYSKILLIKY